MKLRHVDGFVVLTVIILFLGCMAAQGQVGSVAAPPANGPSYQPYSNPQHASQHDLRPEQSLLGSNGVTEAHGERPLWEFSSDIKEISLGDVARKNRVDHAKMIKAVIVWNQQ